MRTPTVNLRVLRREPGAEKALTGNDALFLFYFAAFTNVLADPMNEDVPQIIAGSLAREAPFDVEDLRKRALVLVGCALEGHAANLCKGIAENPSPLDEDDALLMFYALRFGNTLVDPVNGGILRIVVTSLLPDADEFEENDMRAISKRASISTRSKQGWRVACASRGCLSARRVDSCRCRPGEGQGGK